MSKKRGSTPLRLSDSSPSARPLRREPETLQSAIARFGVAAKAKLSNPATRGQPEDQLRSPLERLIKDLALVSAQTAAITIVGEAALRQLKTRPDFAITKANALVGFVELKAPGKGADPRRFRDRHDRDQWDKIQSLPNLIYTDGNSFGLWRYGELVMPIVDLDGDVEMAGSSLTAPDDLVRLITDFLSWRPIPPKSALRIPLNPNAHSGGTRTGIPECPNTDRSVATGSWLLSA